MVSRPHLFGKPISSFSRGTGIPKRDNQAANKEDSETNETENEDSYSDDDDFEEDEEEEEEEEEDEETRRARKEIEEKAKAKLLAEAFAYVANIKSSKREVGNRRGTATPRGKQEKKKQQQQLGWNNKSQFAIREQQRRNKQSLYGAPTKNGSKRGNQGRRRKQKKSSNRAFLEQEQNRYEYRNQAKNLYENMKSKQTGNTSVTMRDLRKRPEIVLTQQVGTTDVKDDNISEEATENSDESIMANRRRLKNQNVSMSSAPNDTATESSAITMSQWKSKPSNTKTISKPILGDSSSKHVNLRRERATLQKNTGTSRAPKAGLEQKAENCR